MSQLGQLSRIGLGYRFVPHGVPIVLGFTRVGDRGTEFPAEVRVFNSHGSDAVITRHVNLKASPTAGNMGQLIKELNKLSKQYGGPEVVDWEALLREASESVIVSHRAGRPVRKIGGAVQRPAAPAWLCRGLLLKDKPNCWLGAASTGKSTLAKAMCAYYAAGFRFCDRETESGVPLYLDWEDDEDAFTRVIFDVCRNLGLDTSNLPDFCWLDMHGYRLRDQIERVAEVIDREHVGLVVLDAVAAAGGGGGEHVNWEDIALEMELCLGSLPAVTVLALDHVTGEELRASRFGRTTLVPAKARGSIRKLEYTRNQWTLMGDEAAAKVGRHVVNWFNTKPPSSGPREAPFATEIVHRADEISVIARSLETVVELDSLDPAEQLLQALGSTSGRTVHNLCLEVDGKEPSKARYNTVRTMLERAVARGVAEKQIVGREVRYRTDTLTDKGMLIPFPLSSK